MGGVKVKRGGQLYGLTSAAGKSAYELAVKAGFVGTEAQWLAGLLGSIDGFNDVDTSTTAPTNGQLLGWRSSDGRWIPVNLPQFLRTQSDQTGTAYTLVLGDAAKFLTVTNAAANTVTVPPSSAVAFPLGTVIEGVQLGAGQTTLTAGAGVTIQASPGLKVAAQYGVWGLRKIGTDTWLGFGRLSS